MQIDGSAVDEDERGCGSGTCGGGQDDLAQGRSVHTCETSECSYTRGNGGGQPQNHSLDSLV